MRVRVEVDDSEVQRTLTNLMEGPDGEAQLKLAAHTTRLFIHTQALVHVETGSLKSSGRSDSSYQDPIYTAHISYGGPSAGVNNPVDYAVYEKERDKTHDDFIESIEKIEGDKGYGDAIVDWLQRRG